MIAIPEIALDGADEENENDEHPFGPMRPEAAIQEEEKKSKELEIVEEVNNVGPND